MFSEEFTKGTFQYLEPIWVILLNLFYGWWIKCQISCCITYVPHGVGGGKIGHCESQYIPCLEVVS